MAYILTEYQHLLTRGEQYLLKRSGVEYYINQGDKFDIRQERICNICFIIYIFLFWLNNNLKNINIVTTIFL